MWTFHGFPFAKANAALKTSIDQAWLDRVRSATVRIASCTGSFVSGEGLILTNHHCVEACLAEMSSKEKSFVEDGYLAKTREEEKKLPDAVRRRAHRHGGHHRQGERRHRRQGRGRRQRRAQGAAHRARAGVREHHQAQVPERVAVRGRAVLAVQVQALHRPAPGVRARGRHRLLRRRPGQLPVSALESRHGHHARLRKRRAGQAG